MNPNSVQPPHPHPDETKSKSALEPSLGLVFEQIMTTNLRCSVCFEIVFETQSLNCSHIFCAHCIDLWLLSHERCPVCREPVKQKTAVLPVDTMVANWYELQPDYVQKERKGLIERRDAVYKDLNTQRDEGSIRRTFTFSGRRSTFADNIIDMWRGLMLQGFIPRAVRDVIERGNQASLSVSASAAATASAAASGLGDVYEYGLKVKFRRFVRNESQSSGPTVTRTQGDVNGSGNNRQADDVSFEGPHEASSDQVAEIRHEALDGAGNSVSGSEISGPMTRSRSSYLGRRP